MEGLKPGTDKYDVAFRERKVEACKFSRGVNSCWDCLAFDSCELIKAHLRDVRFGKKNDDYEE